MLTKLQFQTLFGFKPKRRKSTKKVAKKSASKSGKKVAKKSNKVGTRMIKGVKRTVYKGKNGGKFYKKSNGRKVYFGPALALARSVGINSTAKVIGAKAIEGVGYTLGFKAANIGASMVKKAMKKNKKSVAMGRKKMVSGKKRTVYKSATGAKYYKSAKGNKVYFGGSKDKIARKQAKNNTTGIRSLKSAAVKAQNNFDELKARARIHIFNDNKHVPMFGKKRKSRRNTRFGNHGNATLSRSMGPAPIMFGSHIPNF